MDPKSAVRNRSVIRRLILAGLSALVLLGLLTANASASPRTARAVAGPVTVSVSAKNWTATGVRVTAGELLRITATGRWTDGSATSGPDGAAKSWPDNFFNLADLGVCSDCATTQVPNWGALIGYVGDSPPVPGSYASAAIRPQALRVFYVGGNYEAEVLKTGPLWLFKNADAYSGYTADNSGHLTAKVTVLPPESASQVAARARVAALSVSSATSLQQAWNFCGQAIWNAATSPQMLAVLLFVLAAAVPGTDVADVAIVGVTMITALTTAADTFEIVYNVSDGASKEATVSFGEVVFGLLDIFRDTEIPLYGLVGGPAIDCLIAGFQLSGQLIGQLGALLQKKFLTKADVTASIAGTWKLNRTTVSCVVFATCSDVPITVRFTNCTPTKCEMTGVHWYWKKSHLVMFKNGKWTAQFTDIAVNCGSQLNPAAITITLTVTSREKNSKAALALGGTETVKSATNPPDCKPNASFLADVYGGRS
jgi:hypothetical protein